MNKKIQELALQCYETGPIGNDGWPEYSRLNIEKFVELIVRECRDTVAKTRDEAIERNWNVDEAMSTAMYDIEKHFGVEP